MLKQIDSSIDESQIKLALEQQGKLLPFRGLLYIFWGIILAKCIFAEWAIRKYQLPVNSFYIWIPTLIFASVSTWVYAGVTLRDVYRQPLTGQFVAAIWGGCFMAAALVVVVGYGGGSLSLFILPAICAVILGVGYFIHSVLDQRFIFKLSAYCWWLGSIPLFINPYLDALAWFSLMIILFQVLPATGLYLQWKFKPRQTDEF